MILFNAFLKKPYAAMSLTAFKQLACLLLFSVYALSATQARNGWQRHSISGTVSGSAATVTLSGHSSSVTQVPPNGTFRFAPLANGTYTVTPSEQGYTFSPASQTVTINGGSVWGVNFTAVATAPTYSISGTVTGAGATVALKGASSATTTVAANGTYSFSGLTSGSYTVTPSESGYSFSPASASVTVNGANVTGVNFKATSTATAYSVSGTVSGSAATVTLSGLSSGSATVAQNATYTFSGLLNGSYVVSASEPGFTFSPSSAAVTIAGANVTGVNFTATAQPASVSLSWTASNSSGVSGYDIYRSTVSGGSYTQINSSIVDGTTYVDTNVVAGTSYYYVVTAVNTSGVQSSYSNQASSGSVP